MKTVKGVGLNIVRKNALRSLSFSKRTNPQPLVPAAPICQDTRMQNEVTALCNYLCDKLFEYAVCPLVSQRAAFLSQRR